jgi:hypothetical protein
MYICWGDKVDFGDVNQSVSMRFCDNFVSFYQVASETRQNLFIIVLYIQCSNWSFGTFPSCTCLFAMYSTCKSILFDIHCKMYFVANLWFCVYYWEHWLGSTILIMLKFLRKLTLKVQAFPFECELKNDMALSKQNMTFKFFPACYLLSLACFLAIIWLLGLCSFKVLSNNDVY